MPAPCKRQKTGLNQSLLQYGPRLQHMRLVGIDPGARSFITGVVNGDSQHARTEFSCSTAQYYEQAGFRDRKAWQEKKLNKEPDGLAAWQSNLPTQKSARLSALQDYVARVTAGLQRILSFYFQRPHRARKWQVGILFAPWIQEHRQSSE